MGYRVHYDESMELWMKDFNHIFRHLSVSSVYSYYLGSSKAISVVPVPDSVHCTVINHIFRHLSVSSVYSYYLGSSKAISVVPVPDSVHCTVIFLFSAS